MEAAPQVPIDTLHMDSEFMVLGIGFRVWGFRVFMVLALDLGFGV